MKTLAQIQLAEMAREGTHVALRSYVKGLNSQITNLQPFSLSKIWTQNEQLKLIVDDLIELYGHADFSNGLTDSTGSTDEGNVLAANFFEDIEKRYKNAVQ